LAISLAAKNCLALKNNPPKIETKFLQVSLTGNIKDWFQLSKQENRKKMLKAD
jgi:hypothetical protein